MAQDKKYLEDLVVRTGAANECLRASKEAMERFHQLVEQWGMEFPSATEFKLASQVLDTLADKLSQVSNEDLQYAEELQAMVGDGSYLQSMRNYACSQAESVLEQLGEEEGRPGFYDPVLSAVERTLNQER